jgi:type I restriction enzyme S subunit
MSSEWIDTSLGNVVRFDSGNRNSQDAVATGEYPFFTCSRDILRHSEYDFDREAVIMAGNNAEARFHLQYFQGRFAARQRTYVMSPLGDDLDCRFLFYALQCLQPHFKAHAQGTTTKFVTIGILRDAPICLPIKKEQKAIAHILGTLDDKIELNRKTNETLEAMAKALFKSWFVDFDPVRAKAEGRPTGLPAEISDLFPDSFEDSELGEIPSGWSVHPLSDIFSIQGGSQPPAKTFVDFAGNGYVRLLQIRDFLGDNHLTYVPESKNLRIVGEDDVLIGRYGSGSGKFMEDSLGRPLRGLSGAINVAVVKTHPRQNNMIELIYCMVLSGWFYRQIVGGSSRAVQAGFRKEDLDLIPFPVPPNSILDAFQEIGNNFWHRTKALDVQTKSLCQIRDVLLPKLISGEIRIPDAEKMLEEMLT